MVGCVWGDGDVPLYGEVCAGGRVPVWWVPYRGCTVGTVKGGLHSKVCTFGPVWRGLYSPHPQLSDGQRPVNTLLSRTVMMRFILEGFHSEIKKTHCLYTQMYINSERCGFRDGFRFNIIPSLDFVNNLENGERRIFFEKKVNVGQ